MQIKAVQSNEVRVPQPEEGEAIVVRRYTADRLVLVHPNDFELMHRLYDAFKREPSELSLSELELKAHRISEDHGSDAYDREILAGIEDE